MAVLDQLKTVASKLGIIRVVSAPAEKTADEGEKIQTRSVTLAQLMSEVQAEEVAALAALPADLSVPFEKVCEAAGVKPTSRWTVDRLRDVLRGDKYKSLAREAAQKAIVAELTAEKAAVEDVVKDAIGRDQALDAFEKFAKAKMDKRTEARQRKTVEIESQI